MEAQVLRPTYQTRALLTQVSAVAALTVPALLDQAALAVVVLVVLLALELETELQIPAVAAVALVAAAGALNLAETAAPV